MLSFFKHSLKLSTAPSKIAAFGMCLLTIASLHPHNVAAEDELTFFRIGTGPTSETLYALSTAISVSISRPPGSLPCDTLGGVCGVPGLIAVAQSKSGSIENLNDLRLGEVDSALVRADIANQAFKGIGPFIHDGSNENLRVIADLMPVSAHIIVKENSDIFSVKDLKGKKVSIGANGSGTRLFARSILQAYGLDLHNIIYRHYRPGPAADALTNDDIDAVIIVGAAPIPAFKALASDIKLRLISIENEERETLKRIYAHLNDDSIEQEAYGKATTIQTVSVDVQWVVNASADITLIENITQALWRSETRDFFLRNNPEHYFPKVKTSIPRGLIPAHQGAEIYYKKSGLM